MTFLQSPVTVLANVTASCCCVSSWSSCASGSVTFWSPSSPSGTVSSLINAVTHLHCWFHGHFINFYSYLFHSLPAAPVLTCTAAVHCLASLSLFTLAVAPCTYNKICVKALQHGEFPTGSVISLQVFIIPYITHNSQPATNGVGVNKQNYFSVASRQKF